MTATDTDARPAEDDGTTGSYDPRRWIPTDKLNPDPDNPRGKLRGINELAASVAEHGILEDLLVRFVADTAIIVSGHRRHAAAVKAKLPQVPFRLATDEDLRRIALQRMVTNVQRDDLSPSEHARGVQGLLDLGLSADEVATGLTIDKTDVFAAAKVASSKTAVTVADRYDLTMDQALGIAEFDDDREAVKTLTAWAKRDPGRFDHILERYREDRRIAMEIAAKAAALKAAGTAVFEGEFGRSMDKAEELTDLTDKPRGKALTVAAHKGCPGNAVAVRQWHNGAVKEIPVCSDWVKHGHHHRWRSDSASGNGTKPKSDAAAKSEQTKRRTHLAALNAGRAAQVVRRKFVAELLKRRVAPKGTLAYATRAVLERRIENATTVFCELTGTKLSTGYAHGLNAERIAFVKTTSVGMTEGRLPLALLAAVAAHHEAAWEPRTWDRPGDHSGRREYLEFLVGCGYTPSLVENHLLGKAKPAEVLAESDRLKAERKAAPRPAVVRPPVKAAKRTAKKRAVRRVPARKAAR